MCEKCGVLIYNFHILSVFTTHLIEVTHQNLRDCFSHFFKLIVFITHLFIDFLYGTFVFGNGILKLFNGLGVLGLEKCYFIAKLNIFHIIHESLLLSLYKLDLVSYSFNLLKILCFAFL